MSNTKMRYEDDSTIEKLSRRIIRDMNEGVMVIDTSGRIILVNDRAENILSIEKSKLEGKTVNEAFFDSGDDEFVQTIIDAVFYKEKVHDNVVRYCVGEKNRYIKIITSALCDEEGIVGVIAAITDITELVEVKEHLKLMQRIEELNRQLVEKNKYIRKVFGRYLSDEIVDGILSNPSGLSIGGRYEEVTVLISDLRGFTAICNRLNPNELMDALNYYFDCMSHVICGNGGLIIEYMGDGILALFVPSKRNSDHERTAVYTAIQMQNEIKNVNERNMQLGYPEFKMGIGISTGMAVVGNLGSEYAMRYNVIGNCVNLCGRLESYTVGGQIFVSEETMSGIKDKVTTDLSFEIKPKGVDEQISVYSVTGIEGKESAALESVDNEIFELENPEIFDVFLLEEKKVSSEKTQGKVVGAGCSRLLLDTGIALNVFDNILLSNDKEIYCKVIGKKDNLYVCAVTGGDGADMPKLRK